MAPDLSEILDISEAGMAIQISSPLQVNGILNLFLDLSETKTSIHTTGQVIWLDGSGKSGISFLEMPASSRKQLREWIFQNALIAYDNASARVPELPVPPVLPPRPPRATARKTLAETGSFNAPDAIPLLTLSALAAVRREVELSEPDLDTLLQLVANRAMSFTNATGAAVAFLQGEEMICLASAGTQAPPIGTRLQIGSGFSGECVSTGRVLRCEDSEADPRADRESCRLLGIRSMVAVPIRSTDAVSGLLEVFSPWPNVFTRNDETVLRRLAQYALIAVNRAAQAPAARTTEVTPPPVHLAAQLPQQTSAESTAAADFSLSLGRKILFVAVAVTLVFVAVWLSAPHIQSWISRSTVTSPGAGSKPPAANSSFPMAGEANDLNGIRKLAEQGDPAAQFALGAHYGLGDDVKQDYSEAARWLSKAAEQGHVLAQAMLGNYYWQGRGVPKDLVKAYCWLALARAHGDEASKYQVAILASRMSRAQILAAQQQANDWLTRHQLNTKNPSNPQ